MRRERRRFAAAVTLGAVAGMRTFSAPAIASTRLQGQIWSWRRNRAERFLRKPAVRAALVALAGAELLADKLPSAPDRIRPIPLAARAASGAIVGWSIGQDRAAARRLAVAGALAAVASAYLAWGVRRFIASRSSIPDPLIGACEDVLAIAVGRSARYP
jgi:uncharacterized membrane protein